MIIDCHCHADRAWEKGMSFEPYLERAAGAGIDKTVLWAAFHPDYRRANREVAGVIARHPGRFYGFAFVHAKRDRGRIETMIREAVEEYDFCGIKVHRRDSRLSREVCEAARFFSIPLVYDTMGEVDVVEAAARDYPDVNFIIPHLGSFQDDWKAQAAMTELLARYPNLYTDTSGVKYFDLLKLAVERAGPRKVLFGTDGPYLHPGLELQKIFELGLKKEEEGLLLGGNILGLIERVGVIR